MLDQPLHPAQFVIELRAGRRIAVRQIQACEQHIVERGFDVAAVHVVGITGQHATHFDRSGAFREDGHAIPALLPVPDHLVPGIADCVDGKFFVRCFQLLQTNHIG